MLNELHQLSESIREAGFSGEEWVDSFKPIKTKTAPCFVVSLSEDGSISDIRFMPPDKAALLRTWQGGSNGETFPAFNFTPFYGIANDAAKKMQQSQKLNALRRFAQCFSAGQDFPDDVSRCVCLQDRKKANAKTEKCLGKIARNFFRIVSECGQMHNELKNFSNAFRLFLAQEDGRSVAELFNEKLLSFLRGNFRAGMQEESGKGNESLWPILFAKTSDVVLFLDVGDTSDFRLASACGMKAINDVLMADTLGGEPKSGQLEQDAFGVASQAYEWEEKLPEVKLPGAVANTKLRSMNSESACQMRYGRIDAFSYPVGATVRRSAKAALSWISSPEREGKTWAFAGSGEVVFAYPKKMPKEPLQIARLFGNGHTSSKHDEARFERYAETALAGLKRLGADSECNAEIEVFAIKKADKARRKVVFYRNYTAQLLENSVRNWNSGAKNIPVFSLRKWPSFSKGGKSRKVVKSVNIEMVTPLPVKAIEIAYQTWSQDGNLNFEPKYRGTIPYENLPVFDGIEMFLAESDCSGVTARILSMLTRGTSGLAVSAANLARKGMVLTNSPAIRHLESALPLFGILLYLLKRKKEQYMQNAPYLIGKMLNLADGIHRLWYEIVKKGDPLPPQLLGSAYYALFQQNPVQGLSAMSLRIKTYLDWASTNLGEKAGLARWYRGEIGKVAAELKTAGVPERLSDADKAEMLLGYLAGFEKKHNNETQEETREEQDHE